MHESLVSGDDCIEVKQPRKGTPYGNIRGRREAEGRGRGQGEEEEARRDGLSGPGETANVRPRAAVSARTGWRSGEGRAGGRCALGVQGGEGVTRAR
ncbi:hypothetical protein X777_05925 [Ooceraea biroi]|uniref:Uncharacterized protein n=1 Tax=Ooceraea biroi TaxID=2015173 RepID=A0A026WEJ0_OOCBI|nr:hypothetical protein X777_05925 [Ooceraea biroi]